MEKDEVQTPAPRRQNSLCPLPGPYYNILQCFRAQQCAPHPILPAAVTEHPDPCHFRLRRRNNDLAAHLMRDAFLLTERQQTTLTAQAQLCLARAGFVVDSRMYDARISAGLAQAEMWFLFEDDDAAAGAAR